MPFFMVDKKGSVVGRNIWDYTMFNNGSEDCYSPVPEADQVRMNACGKDKHTAMDCVLGFSQIYVDDGTAELLSTITSFGVFKPKVARRYETRT